MAKSHKVRPEADRNSETIVASKLATPDRSTAAAFPRYLAGEVLADSVALQWPALYARRWRLPRVVDRLLVPATPEPHISCNLGGMAEFQERDVGGAWISRQIRAGELFVTRSRAPYEVRFESPPGQRLDNLSLHIGVSLTPWNRCTPCYRCR